jgi:hypothetical protein
VRDNRRNSTNNCPDIGGHGPTYSNWLRAIRTEKHGTTESLIEENEYYVRLKTHKVRCKVDIRTGKRHSSEKAKPIGEGQSKVTALLLMWFLGSNQTQIHDFFW